MDAILNRQRRVGRMLVVGGIAVGALLLAAVRPVQAQFNLSLGQRAADGTVYEVIALDNIALSGGADEVRITTVAGGPNGLQSCSLAASMITAAVGANSLVPQTLHAYTGTLRTGILTPSDFTIAFNTAGSGRLTIGSSPGGIDVCRDASNCVGGATDATVVALSSNSGGIPAACIATGVTASCLGGGSVSTFAFGVAADVAHHCTASPTTTSTTCGAQPADGFTLQKGQVVVFIYDGSLGKSGFTNGAGGFGIDTNGANTPMCPANTIVTADAQAPSSPPPPPTTTPPTTAPTLSASTLALTGLLLVWRGARIVGTRK